MSRLARTVNWQNGSDPRVPYVATVEGERWEIRLGDPASASRYTLVVNGAAVEEISDWPASWGMPKDDDDPYQKREMELELEKLERTRTIKPSKLV